jgi:NitT/TauT family transport system substrate-binding protein
MTGFESRQFFPKRLRDRALLSMKRMTVASLAVISLASVAAAQDAVKVSLVSSASILPLFVAQDKGYFKDQNLAVEFVSVAGATDAITMAATGQTDVGTAAVGTALFNAAARGLKFSMVASLSIHPAPTTVIPLMIRKDLWDSGKVRTGKDLKGLRVSINSPGGSIEYKLALIMKKYGMTIKDVTLVSIGLPETVTAFGSGGVDAAVLGEPFATAAVKRGLAVIDVEDSSEMIGDHGTGLIFGEAFMRDRRDVGVRFMKALIRASADVQLNNWKTKENIDITTKYTKVAPETVAEMAFPEFYPDLSPSRTIESMKRQAAMHVENGRMPATAAPFAETIVDESFVKAATGK